jgi:hypothetical protein
VADAHFYEYCLGIKLIQDLFKELQRLLLVFAISGSGVVLERLQITTEGIADPTYQDACDT